MCPAGLPQGAAGRHRSVPSEPSSDYGDAAIRTPALPSSRRLLVLALTAGALLAAASPARAADLLLLDGEQQTISGERTYGIVYVDGELRLSGDTTINAASVYVGPNAGLRTCFVEPNNNGGCTAGRSLTIRSAGPLVLASGIDLTAGTGTVRNGGSLNLIGKQVAVGGDLNTTGSGGGASGSVTISSDGPLSTGAITAYGAPVRLTAGGAIDTGDVQTQGASSVAAPDAGRVQYGAPVTIVSSGGDVRINGSVNTWGRDAPANGGLGLGGGVGADVSISGGDVRVGNVDSTGGSSADASAGPSGAISLDARGALHALGRLDAGGSGATVGNAVPGGRIAANAGGGPLVVAGGAWAGGGQSPLGGAPGGEIVLGGQSVDAGTLFAAGANASNAAVPRNGGAGGQITVTSGGRTSITSLQAYGGNSPDGASPGNGGGISVKSTGGAIATGRVTTQGGYPGGGAGANGGPITLSAQSDLTVADQLTTSGTSANGTADPSRPGGSAGAILLRAGTGTLTLGDTVRAEGGYGAAHPVDGVLGAPGGAGGRIDVVAHALGQVVALSSHGGSGGDYGDDQGGGGAGGSIYAWTEAALFDDQKVVDTDGGSGHPLGASGAKVREQAPGTPVIDAAGNLSFASRSPDAQGFRVLRSVAGGAPEVVLDTTKTSGLRPPAPACTPVTFSVVAYQTGVDWISDASAPVAYTRPASSTQGCGDAPKLTAAKRARLSLRKLRKAGWKAAIPVRSSGIGSVTGSLLRAPRKGRRTSKKPLATATLALPKPGAQKLKLRLPKAVRHRGRLIVRLVSISPDGKGRTTSTLSLEIVR